VSNALARTRRRFRGLSPLKHELVVFALALLFALAILPFVIWLAGRLFLGDYLRDYSDSPELARHGGPLALLLDYLRGIAAGSPGHWLVLLGPYVLLCIFRLGRRLS